MIYAEYRERHKQEYINEYPDDDIADIEEILDMNYNTRNWASELESQAFAKIRHSDETLDDYYRIFGASVFTRTFRGQQEQKGYLPKHIRNPEPIYWFARIRNINTAREKLRYAFAVNKFDAELKVLEGLDGRYQLVNVMPIDKKDIPKNRKIY